MLVVENQLSRKYALPQKYALPGGSIETGETIEATLKREAKEETGIEVRVGRFLGFKQRFFYFDPLEEAYQGFFFYYLCYPLTNTFTKGWNPGDIEGNPRWIDIDSIDFNDFYNGDLVEEILQLLTEGEMG